MLLRRKDDGIKNDKDACMEPSERGSNGSAENGCNGVVTKKKKRKQEKGWACKNTVEVLFLSKLCWCLSAATYLFQLVYCYANALIFLQN